MLRTYDPKEVHVIVGAFPIGGFADGDSIKVVRSSDTFEKIIGIGGVVSRAKMLDRSGEVTLTLEQTSMSNDILSALAIADELTNSGILPLTIVEFSNQTVLFSAYGWLKKPADVVFGKSLSKREWVFHTSDIDVFIGGNAS